MRNHPHTPTGADPVFPAIERHRLATATLREADRDLAQLEDGLPFDVRRGPRVQIAAVRRREGIDEPTYAHSRSEIDGSLRRWSGAASREVLEARRGELHAALEADAAALASAQARVGLTAARDRFDRACAAEDEALQALVRTAPTTLAGAAALASYLADSDEGIARRSDEDGIDRITLATLGAALQALAPTA